jgi:predicted protein tyrosine phosphatase
MNQDITVVDAELSGSHTAKYGYDINEEIQRTYDFNCDDEARELHMVPMLKHDRSVIFNQARKLGLIYESGTKPDDESLPAPLVLRKPKGYSKKVWDSAYGPKSKKEKSYSKVPVGASEILPGKLFLGSGRDADAIDDLLDKKITHVLNVTSEWKENPDFKAHDISFQRIVIKDFVTESIEQHFEVAFEFIDRAMMQQDGRILVHCVIGKSRSSSVVIAFLMSRHKMTLSEAVAHVKKTRDMIRPNDNFLAELQRYEAALYPHLEGRPTLVHEDLPPMKDPGTAKKSRDNAGEAFIGQTVTRELALEALGDLEPIRKNYQRFIDSLLRLLKKRHPQEFQKLREDWSEKAIRKLLAKSLFETFDALRDELR